MHAHVTEVPGRESGTSVGCWTERATPGPADGTDELGESRSRSVRGSQPIPGAVQVYAVPSVMMRPRTRGNRTGACAKQYSRLLYCERMVSQPRFEQRRSPWTVLDGRADPVIRRPFNVVVSAMMFALLCNGLDIGLVCRYLIAAILDCDLYNQSDPGCISPPVCLVALNTQPTTFWFPNISPNQTIASSRPHPRWGGKVGS